MIAKRSIPRWIPSVVVLVAVLVAASGLASACLAQATLSLDRTAARPGTIVTGTGRGFSGGRMSDGEGYGPVVIRWKRVDGRVLWSGRADSNQSIAFSLRVPRRADPGYYVVTATQVDESGRPAYGTPARTTLRVKRPR